MLTLKQGVRLDKLQPQIVLGLLALNQIWERYGYGPCVVTSGSEGVHKAGSLHYSGRAVDIRTRHVHPDDLTYIISQARNALGMDFDVVLEVDHIHLEYDPKK